MLIQLEDLGAWLELHRELPPPKPEPDGARENRIVDQVVAGVQRR